MDAVGEDGDVFVGYRASLRWRGVRVSYASALAAGGADASSRATIRPGPGPDLLGGALSWTEPRLGVAGTWETAESKEISRVLHESSGGRVVWRCVLPSAGVEVRRGESVLRGLGYAEHLEMTLPPWKLPIDTLRWGRFLAAGSSVVWIDWEAKSARRTWIFVNGTSVRGDVSEEDVLFEGGRLRLPAPARLILREGRLSQLLGNLPLRSRLGVRASGIHEIKWRTRGVLQCAEAPAVEGWAIHEVVRFRR